MNMTVTKLLLMSASTLFLLGQSTKAMQAKTEEATFSASATSARAKLIQDAGKIALAVKNLYRTAPPYPSPYREEFISQLEEKFLSLMRTPNLNPSFPSLYGRDLSKVPELIDMFFNFFDDRGNYINTYGYNPNIIRKIEEQRLDEYLRVVGRDPKIKMREVWESSKELRIYSTQEALDEAAKYLGQTAKYWALNLRNNTRQGAINLKDSSNWFCGLVTELRRGRLVEQPKMGNYGIHIAYSAFIEALNARIKEVSPAERSTLLNNISDELLRNFDLSQE